MGAELVEGHHEVRHGRVELAGRDPHTVVKGDLLHARTPLGEEHDAVRAAAARGLAALATPNLLDELRRAALGGGPELRFACTRALLSLRQVVPHLRYTHVAVMRVTHAGHFVVAPEQGKPWPHQSNGARVGSFTIAHRNGERHFVLAP